MNDGPSSEHNKRPDGPNGEPDKPVGDAPDPDLPERRLRAQVETILRALPDAVPVFSAPDELDYIYRAGWILCSDADVARVRAVVGDAPPTTPDAGGAPPSEAPDDSAGLVNGVTALRVADVPTALAAVDRELGVGVATPDHVLWVASTSRCCPATEPDPVTVTVPHPKPRTDPRSSGAGTLVSVVDTGFIPSLVNAAHPWLDGVTGDTENFNAADIAEYVGHGTFIAGVVRGVAPRADVRVEGFLTNGGAVYESKIVTQLSQAMDLMPDVISLSAGSTTRKDLPLKSFEAFYEKRLRGVKGPVIVAAAGNDGSRGPFYPAAFEWTISVGALDRHGHRADYSNFGSWVDVYALGSDIVNAYPNGTYKYHEPPRSEAGDVSTFTNEMAAWSGTSFSTPIVAGMIAARMSATGQTARQAANSILRIARAHAKPGIGAIADPAMLADADPAGDFWE